MNSPYAATTHAQASYSVPIHTAHPHAVHLMPNYLYPQGQPPTFNQLAQRSPFSPLAPTPTSSQLASAGYTLPTQSRPPSAGGYLPTSIPPKRSLQVPRPEYKPKDKSSGRAKKPKRSKKQSKRSIWDTLLCMDEKSSFAKGWNQLSEKKWCTPTEEKRRNRGTGKAFKGFDQIKLSDGTMFSVDDESDDWDLLYAANLGGHDRRGPERKVSNDISIRDLFPCLGDIFDFCGCAEKKTERLRAVPPRPNHRSPQLETVCLECGHVLDQRNLGKSILHDALPNSYFTGRCPGGGHHRVGDSRLKKIADSRFVYGYGDPVREWERKSSYSGYDGWEFEGDESSTASSPRNGSKVPLPHFLCDQPRKFRSRPGQTVCTDGKWCESDYVNLDETGRVVLPDFGTKPATEL